MPNFAHWMLASAAAGVVSMLGLDTSRRPRGTQFEFCNAPELSLLTGRAPQAILEWQHGRNLTEPQIGLRRSSITHITCFEELHVRLQVPLWRLESVVRLRHCHTEGASS